MLFRLVDISHYGIPHFAAYNLAKFYPFQLNLFNSEAKLFRKIFVKLIQLLLRVNIGKVILQTQGKTILRATCPVKIWY